MARLRAEAIQTNMADLYLFGIFDSRPKAKPRTVPRSSQALLTRLLLRTRLSLLLLTLENKHTSLIYLEIGVTLPTTGQRRYFWVFCSGFFCLGQKRAAMILIPFILVLLLDS